MSIPSRLRRSPAAEPQRRERRLHGRGDLDRSDMHRLRYACGRADVDPTRSLFGRRSVTWRINRETVTLLGGGSALLLQIAHPLIAAGVAEHSNFRRAPIERLRRTLELMLAVVFSDAAGALGAVRQVERVHARVRGTLPERVGPFRRGSPYDANRPELLFWVHATLVDTALRAYERLVGPVGPHDRRRYYDESKITARLFAIPESRIPPTWRDFQTYMRRMVNGSELTVGRAAREIAQSILTPPVPLGIRQAMQASNLFTAAFLPDPLRRGFGLRWDRRRQAGFDVLAGAIRRSLPYWPALQRFYPDARRAGADRC